MRCKCNTGGIPRYIVLLNGQQLRCNDETEQEPLEPLNVCVFYHSIVPTSEHHYSWITFMTRNGFTIEGGFAKDWGKDFAHPTQAWTLPKSETNKFMEHKMFITIQTIMERVFFETEQQIILFCLIGSLTGLSWKNVLLLARDTVHGYFNDNNITGTGRTAWWLRLQARGLSIAVNPSSGIDLDMVEIQPIPQRNN